MNLFFIILFIILNSPVFMTDDYYRIVVQRLENELKAMFQLLFNNEKVSLLGLERMVIDSFIETFVSSPSSTTNFFLVYSIFFFSSIP